MFIAFTDLTSFIEYSVTAAAELRLNCSVQFKLINYYGVTVH